MSAASGPVRQRRKWLGWVAGGVAAALVVTLAVVANGFDSRETPREDPSVWVERVAGQYARVNTETAEIDTVRAADSPSDVVQTGSLGVLLTQGYGRAWAIDPAAPEDVRDDGSADPAEGDDEAGADEDSAGEPAGGSAPDAQPASNAEPASDGSDSASEGVGAIRTPDGTREVIAEGDYVLFFTQNGSAHLSEVVPATAGEPATLSAPLQLDPLAEESGDEQADEAEGERASYLADAVAMDQRGLVALYSKAENAVRWYDANAAKWRGGPESVPSEIASGSVQLTIADGEWAILDAETGLLWREGSSEAAALDVVGNPRLQTSSSSNGDVLIADEAGLWRANRDGVDRVVQAEGVPAQPRYVDEDPVAAWVGSSAARMWTGSTGDIELQLDDTVDDLSNPDPEVRSNGGRAVVVERRSGMMWTVPDGRLIPVEQWSLVDPPKQESGTVVTQDVTEQEPPVAVDDAFGVRAGEPALLPVLLNDYDPNRKDVLTVVPDALGEGLDQSFGSLSAASDGQSLIVQPSAAASGSTSFSYRVTDGVNVSQPATVTLTAVEDSTNTAPEWCPVEGCQRPWPSPEIEPGGTLIMPILEGWVDPQGDPMMLGGASVVTPGDPIRALVTADGRLAVRHTDPNAEAGDFVVRVRVVDGRGAETERDLRVRVRSGAAVDFTSAAMTVKVGETTVFRPLDGVTGGSGSFELVDALVQQGALTATANQGAGTVDVLAASSGSALLSVTVRDIVTQQEVTGAIRVTAVDARPDFGVPPLRAFVRPLADSTVDVLAAIPGSNSRALTVQSATVKSGQLRADVIEHSRVRVSGSTPDGQPGRIGAVDVVVTEGEATAHARLTVFQVPDSGLGAIAVNDNATVRAGSVVDIPVLDNDVAPPGERLVLHPEVAAPGTDGELAFASGSTVRYLAPDAPGSYTLSYTTYGASSPEQSDVGQVRVTVLPAGSNRDPMPATVTVRVAPGERIQTTVPLSGVDPDGDRLRLVGVDSPEDPQLATSLLARRNSLQVDASASAERGTSIVNYTVRDSYGGEANGRLRIIVTEPDPGGGAPVVYSDYVRISNSATDPAVVRPLDNDLDPSGGTLSLVSVEPNVPGGEASPLYRQLRDRLDTSALKRGLVSVTGGTDLGTVSYKYTVVSSESKSTADGLIVVQVSERIGQQAPAVSDTVLSVRDRADFERAGVDVVTDHVRWAAGDPSTLKLSLWGGASRDYRVEGSNIIGKYRAEGDLVAFRLSGVDMTGAEVESFGFLIVPPLDELRLTLKPDAAALSVAENKSVDASITDLLDLGRGDQVELAQASFTTQRAQASCTATGTTTFSYAAGREAPWTDYCTVRVKLTEQQTYTVLPIPVAIVPNEPVVQLNPLTRTVAPGASETINLVDMVQWQGGREGDVGKLRWQVSGGASAFEVSSSGSQVRVQARANAVPGNQEGLTIGVSGSGDAQSLLTLRVGQAPTDAPRGGTVSLQCTVGSPCSTPLVGIGGEYDPFAGKSGGGLRLVSVDDGGCQFGTMRASGDSVNVSWGDPRGPGGRCTATFTVKDAQNRTGTGSIEFDAQGVPRAPTSVTAVYADGSSVRLSVTLSTESSHPATTGVKLSTGGGRSVGNCELSGGQAICTVSGLTPGERRTYFAVATNSVGDSASSANGAETWAYRPPAPPTISAEPRTWADNTDPGRGRIRIDIGRVGGVTRVLTVDGAQTPISSNGLYVVPAGRDVTLKVVSVDSPDNVPPGFVDGANANTGTANETTVRAIGAPREGEATLELRGEDHTAWRVERNDEWSRNGGDELSFTYSIHNYVGPSNEGDGLPKNKKFSATVTASNSYGTTGEVSTNEVVTGRQLPKLHGTYKVNKTPVQTDDWQVEYRWDEKVVWTPEPEGDLSEFSITPGSPRPTVTQCINDLNCSEAGEVEPAGLEPLRLTLTQCVPWDGTTVPGHATIAPYVDEVGAPGAAYTLTAASDGTITIDWAGDARGVGTFSGGLCDPTGP